MAGIGTLVTNLTVNNTGFTKGLSGAQSSLKMFSGGISKMIGPVAGALAGVWGTSASISAARTQLQAEQKLASVLAATGGAAGLTATEIGAYSGELQKLTNFGDEVTLSAAGVLASFRNIKGDVFKDALAAAQDMSSVMGTDLQGTVVQLGKALNDPTQGITALSRAGVTFSDQQKEQIRVMQESGNLLGAQSIVMAELKGEFGGAAQAMADPWTQFQNVLGDVGENIGSTLLPTINVLSENLSGMIGSVAGGGDAFKTMGIDAAVWLKHAGWELAIAEAKFELFFAELGNDASHFFTEAIPAYLTWFGDNWDKVMFTAGDYAMTIFINIGENLKNMWQTVLDFFAGNEVDFNWTPLTEGVKSAIDKMPDVPKRLTTAFEAGLKSDIKAMTDGMNESMATSRASLESMFSPLAKVPIAPTLVEDTGAAVADTKATKATKTDLKAAFAGSSEAASIMLRGVGGKSVEQNTAKLVTTAEKQLIAIKENKPPETFAINFA